MLRATEILFACLVCDTRLVTFFVASLGFKILNTGMDDHGEDFRNTSRTSSGDVSATTNAQPGQPSNVDENSSTPRPLAVLTSSSDIIHDSHDPVPLTAAVSPVAVRAVRDRRAAAMRKSADDVELQRKENERLRTMLARERYERIHRVANARKDAVSRTLSPLQPHPGQQGMKRASPQRAPHDSAAKTQVTPNRESPGVALPSPSHDAVCEAGTDDEHGTPARTLATSPPPTKMSSSMHVTASGVVAPRNRSKLLAPLHPLAVDQAASPGKSQRYWDRKVDAITTKEHDERAQISSDERHNFLLVRRVLRLLRQDEQRKFQLRTLVEKQAEVKVALFLDEIKGRIRSLALRDKAFVDGVFAPFEGGIRVFIAQEERSAMRYLHYEFKKELRLWRAVEHRQHKAKGLEREDMIMQSNEDRLLVIRECAKAFEDLHMQFSVGRDAIRQAHVLHGLSLMDDKRRKRAEVLEAELTEERQKRQQRQKLIDAKLNEERKLHSSWADWELLRSRIVYAEHELWALLMRMFRSELTTVRSLAKLRRVEGYCYDALKEMPTVTLTQLLNTAPSSAYVSQVAPLLKHHLLGDASPVSLLEGQNRPGMETVGSFLEPIRRDREALPKYLKATMEDETCPLFVGSYISTGGGMFVDPSVDFSIDMGETWGARLLVCWSYAKEESEKLGRQIIRRMLGCIHSAEKLAYQLGPESSTFRKAQSKKSFVKSRSSKSLDTNRTELLTTSLQDVAVTVPTWVDAWRGMLSEDLQQVRKHFPNVPLPEPKLGTSPWQAALTGSNPLDVHDADRQLPVSALTISAAPTPTDTSLGAAGGVALSGSFVLDVSALQQLQMPLVDMKAAKERLTAAVVFLDAVRVSGDVFADGLPHYPCLSIHPSELEEMLGIHTGASVDVQRQLTPSSLQVRIKPKDRHGAGGGASYLSSYVVRDLVRLIRLHLLDDVDEWSIPKTGITVTVRVRVRCTLTAVSTNISISEAASLHELLDEVLASKDVVDHESDEMIECFLLPFQLLPTPSVEAADADIPEHDCRTNQPFVLCPSLELRLMPRLERHEEITTEIEGWDEEVQNTSFCFTSRRSSVAQPIGGGDISPGGANRSPVLAPGGSPRMQHQQASPLIGSPNNNAVLSALQLVGSPKSPTLSASSGKKVVSLKKEIVRRRTAIVIPNNGEYLTACEGKGLEVSFSIFDGINLNDKITIVSSAVPDANHRTGKGIFWDEKAVSGEGSGTTVVVDGHDVATAMQQLCSLRISFLPNTPVALVERVCRAVAIHCGQYTSRIGIRVVQVVVSRPYDKVHAPLTSRWVAPSAAYVAVKITATDTPPTFTLPQRMCYRGAFSGGATGSSNAAKAGATPRAAQLQQQAAEASKLWRVEPKKLAIGKDAIVEDPDTQFFRGGFMSVDVRNYEAGDHIALDLKEFDQEGGMDGVRMQFVDDPEAQVASQMPMAWKAWAAAFGGSAAKGVGPASALTDRTCALLSFHGDPIGLLAVEFHSIEGPSKLTRRQSALWGETGAGAANADSKVSSSSVLRRRKSSVSFQMTPAGARIPVLSQQSQQSQPQQKRTMMLPGAQVAQSIDIDVDEGGEPRVQRPLGSLQGGQHEGGDLDVPQHGEESPFTTDARWRQQAASFDFTELSSGNAPTNNLANSTTSDGAEDASAAIEGISKLRIFFDNRVPFEAIQMILRNLVYYRGTLLVPSGETLVDITIGPGKTIECFDVHGDMVSALDDNDDSGADGAAPVEVVMQRTIVIDRSPPLLNIAEKDRTTTYVENSGARRLFQKVPPFPSDVVAFDGGYLRVEICQDDLEDEDEIILDVPLEKMRRIFLKLDMLQEHLPDTLGTNRGGKKSIASVNGRPSDSSSKVSVTEGSHIDVREKVAKERAMSLRVIDATPREPPSHSGPPVAVSALRRLGSMKRSKAGTSASQAAPPLEGNQSAGFSPMWSPQDGAIPKHRSPLPFVGLDPPLTSAAEASLPVVIDSLSNKSVNLWGKVRKDVAAAATASRFLANTAPAGGNSHEHRTTSMYSKVFDLVRQSASSHVLVRRLEELERYGIDDTFVYRMQQNEVAQGLQSAAISTGTAMPLTATAPTTVKSASSSPSSVKSPTTVKSPSSIASLPQPPRTPPPPPPAIPQLPSATVCCLADFDDNNLGTLFTRHGCISIAFDPLLPSLVLKGHTLPVQPQAVIQKLLSCVAFRSTSRNPSILQKRITFTLVHPISGRTMVFLKLNIDPVDDPTEMTTLKPQISVRANSTETEPYTEPMIQAIWAQRARYGVHPAMPESSIASLLTLSEKASSVSAAFMNTAACLPRWDIIPVLPSWCTTVFDPDTIYWDGGRIELHTSTVTFDGASFTSKVTPAMRQQLQSSFRILSAMEQQELLSNIERFGIGLGGSASGEVPPESQPSSKWVLHTRQSTQSSRDLSIWIQERGGGGVGRLLATVKAPEEGTSPTTAGEGHGSGASSLLVRIEFSDDLLDGEKWITVDMLAAVFNSICVERADLLRLVEPAPMNISTTSTVLTSTSTSVAAVVPVMRNSMVFPISVRVWDPVNPKCGETSVSLEVCAPLLSWPVCTDSSAPGSPHEDASSPSSSVKERRLSLQSKTPNARPVSQDALRQFTPEGSFIVYTSLREATAVQGELCFQNLTIRIPDKDRVGGGFVELIALQGHRPEDRFTVLPPSNQMVITTDGIITSKEGNLGRIYGNNSTTGPYLRIDLSGYWFEGTKKMNYNASKQDLVAPPGIDPVTGGGRISTFGGIAWSKQVAGRVSGKRLSTLLRSIYFRTEPADGVGASTLVGTRQFVLNVCDGRYDVYGRLEVSSIPLVIQVIDAPLPKF